ncbi:phosphatidylinositol phosphate kinase [Bodo saltans virus]|uniref:Phosphatidylinositol phosphate kinase n=1 Tax=Bodo saltans virus TaxID=2024608 RepID=A0A2H4UVW6_9VIRU|nr:phosphatidylinositol phosphate kinase [Bodo saltans virus]ATZ81017.1 phosphatidylinositol phosphate kinase [Bodo saltans virus]
MKSIPNFVKINNEVTTLEKIDNTVPLFCEINFNNGNRYNGWIMNNCLDGVGKMTYYQSDILSYDGNWKNDTYNGKGTIVYSDKTTCNGEFKNGKICGHGVVMYETGGKYDGKIENNKRNGRGVHIYADGGKYDGEWKDDKRNGHGVLIYADGSKYDGEWKNDKRNGHGVLIYADGGKYDGEWKDDKLNGHGICIYKSGLKYDGEWKDDKYDGHGVLIRNKSYRFNGCWKNGNFDNGEILQFSKKITMIIINHYCIMFDTNNKIKQITEEDSDKYGIYGMIPFNELSIMHTKKTFFGAIKYMRNDDEISKQQFYTIIKQMLDELCSTCESINMLQKTLNEIAVDGVIVDKLLTNNENAIVKGVIVE